MHCPFKNQNVNGSYDSATIDKGVCYPHISIYADEMTYMGKVVSAERNGLS